MYVEPSHKNLVPLRKEERELISGEIASSGSGAFVFIAITQFEMLIKEFRVTLPMTVDEYQVAQLYSVAEASKNETGGGEGVERRFRKNVHELEADKLKMREVVKIDIANDDVSRGDYKEDEDPVKYKSQKTGRGPLSDPQWIKSVEPVMTAYKLVTVQFKWFGIQGKVENFIQQTERRLFLNFHRQVFCWTDKWHGLTMEDIRAIEDKN
ncbi:Cytoplasmic phosphatidylinositol transfer protein 1,Phosphatidylinositol transfer protein 4,Phosphatidylinositol transfer protein beta isoform,Phosphatidylinositol transfer protein 2,Phosphatidylinositol transfer protein 1,Phosphatidylinositol transfer protein 5,Phosphatidylinositol transfer protein alpha isoform [Lepeophtheirus salmonis]|uniref:Phosphatidylinositol transfer protein N-terminal domain-containing protein n=1 Tax=Lepeophtheirus salmonis TaxID=72036 RepID=A0A7R8CVW8_LEPSM|nr:Cytoplasmic phosphatidylinositol transfer protein 1,Phosphatidylinositol transfer protein 4,Phosphatidylinositol transfer protein beta isoform,Phosphatidylinositol transfer protein 2,Phosphatidylinositol transfer protein 1,Phosphatidylinositol transfer protein 5,Phosphatidylinositol transfer protein alpha isoform [Lepeophtheirus salmonis]CAF2948333.1 Cytoplasmic phosphatidylinositol transfer protein 1,Phosphatidylinositol transfer protein 4,Phosphatidylinositol transfer protein beta isoform,Pho